MKLSLADKLLLGVCCGPCALPIIESLRSPLFFCGPNIYPEEEYYRRLRETRKIAEIYGLEMDEGDYDHDQWLSFIKERLPRSPESYPENSGRCLLCFRYRLAQTAEFAKKRGFDSFATTLSVSRFKDVAAINRYGKEQADKFALNYRTFQLDAGEAHRRGLELSKKHNIYRQKYCGCEFSLHKGSLPGSAPR